MAENKTVSVAVLSGKGGVGKSNLALNLAYSLYLSSFKVLLVDCDLGLANLDVLLGLTPENNIQSLLDSDMNPEQAVVPIEPGGFDLLPATSGIADVSAQKKPVSPVLVQKLNSLAAKYDFVFMDIGAGISPSNLSFASIAQIRLMVITPEPTSLTDGYAMIKVLASRHGVRDHFILVNQVESKKEEEQTLKSLQAATTHFLNINPSGIGSVRADRKLSEAVRKQQALVKAFPKSNAAQDCMAIAAKLRNLRQTMLPRIADIAPLRVPGNGQEEGE